MILIITGMDNTGKTTLAEKISQELGYPLTKSLGGQASDPEKIHWTLNALAGEESLQIFDRFAPLEENVYGVVLRNRNRRDPIFGLDSSLMKLLKKVPHLIIYTRTSRDNIMDFGTRLQMSGVKENFTSLLEAWDDLYFKLLARGYKVISYDYEEVDINSFIEGLKIIMNNMENQEV